jgi:hypothetical protein
MTMTPVKRDQEMRRAACQAFEPERVRGGIKDVLPGPAQLYEALRAKEKERRVQS